MTEWHQTTLGTTVDTLVGFAFKSADFSNDSGDIRLLRGVNIGQGSLDWERCAYWPPDAVPNPKYWLQEGDVVLAMDRPWIGAGLKRARVRSSDLPALLVQRVTRLRGTDAVRTSFVHHLIASETFSRYLQGIVTGATVPHISESQIRAFRFSLPSVQEQDQICGILDALDELIENNRRRIALLEQVAQAIYQEWFIHFRFPGHGTVPLVDSPVGPIPEGWEVKPFAEVASFVNGFAFKPAHWGVLGRPIIKIKQLKDGVTWDTPRCPENEIDEKYWVQAGDLLFSWSADLGVYRWSGEPGLLNQHLFVVTPTHRLPVSFLYHSLANAMSQFWDRAQGTTMRHIKRSALSQVSSVVPAQAVLEAFESAVEPAAQHVIRLRRCMDQLARIRDLVLPKLVTGQINVSEVDVDPLVDSVT